MPGCGSAAGRRSPKRCCGGSKDARSFQTTLGGRGAARRLDGRDLVAAPPRAGGRAAGRRARGDALPGLFSSDRSNFVMAGYLRRLGYRAQGWGLGRNRGARSVGADAERLVARVGALAAEAGPVTLVGVSLGGMIARLVAHGRPDLVRAVVTVSSPYAGDPHATNIWRAFELFTGERVDDPAVRARAALIASPLPVPATAIWSATDGLVAGAICRCHHAEGVEVRSGHLGVQLKPEVLVAVAMAIGQA